MIALALAMGVSFSHLAYNTHKEAEPTSWRTFTTEFEPPDPVVLKMEVSRVSVRTLRPESDLPATGAYVLLLQAHHITSKAVSQSPDGLPRFLLRASSTQRPDEMTQSGVIAAESHGGPVRSPPPTKPST